VRVFVGFGFNPRDAWIRQLVFPMITAFAMDAVDGMEAEGQIVTEAVRERIRLADAFIGFTTRRDPIDPQRWTTHRWVTDELSHALALDKPVVEIRETGVDDQGGIAGDRQRIVYDEASRCEALVQLAGVLGRWQRSHDRVLLQLLPAEFINQIVPIYRKPGFACRYRVMVNGEEGPPALAKVKPIKGGLFLEAADVPREGLVQVEIEYGPTSWISGFESVDAIGIVLRRSD
jgi:hypothetical protein